MLRVTYITRVATAALLGTFLTTGAMAQTGPHLVGSGNNLSVEYDMPSQNIVGGALYRTTGSGESARQEAIEIDHAQAPGPIATLVGSGESQHIVYYDAPDGGSRLADIPAGG